MDEPGVISASMIIEELERIATPFGATILSSKPERWRAQRVEVRADKDGRFLPVEKERLCALLSTLLFQDAYLSSEITLDDKVGFCTWHVIGGDAYPLNSDHSESVLLLYGTLLPEDSTIEQIDEIVDAPSLTAEF